MRSRLNIGCDVLLLVDGNNSKFHHLMHSTHTQWHATTKLQTWNIAKKISTNISVSMATCTCITLNNIVQNRLLALPILTNQKCVAWDGYNVNVSPLLSGRRLPESCGEAAVPALQEWPHVLWYWGVNVCHVYDATSISQLDPDPRRLLVAKLKLDQSDRHALASFPDTFRQSPASSSTRGKCKRFEMKKTQKGTSRRKAICRKPAQKLFKHLSSFC